MSTYRDDLDAAKAREAATPLVTTSRPPTRVPAGISFEQSADRIVVSWRPGDYDFFTLVFGLGACAVVPILFAGMRYRDTFDYLMLIGLGALCYPLGLAMIYSGIGRILNKVRLSVTRDSLETYEGPWPWPKRERFAVSELRQLFVAKDAKTHLSAQLSSAEVQLIPLPSMEAAHYAEEAIERFLGIEDRPVRGEAPLSPPSPPSP